MHSTVFTFGWNHERNMEISSNIYLDFLTFSKLFSSKNKPKLHLMSLTAIWKQTQRLEDLTEIETETRKAGTEKVWGEQARDSHVVVEDVYLSSNEAHEDRVNIHHLGSYLCASTEWILQLKIPSLLLYDQNWWGVILLLALLMRLQKSTLSPLSLSHLSSKTDWEEHF